MDLSQGAVANIIARAAAKLQPQADAIGEQVRASPVIGSDETGARVDGRLPEIPLKDQPGLRDAVFGDVMPKVWLSDGFSAQLKARARARQLCHAHQVRDLKYGVDAERSRFAYEMQRLLLSAQGLAKRRADHGLDFPTTAHPAPHAPTQQHPPPADDLRLWKSRRPGRHWGLVAG